MHSPGHGKTFQFPARERLLETAGSWYIVGRGLSYNLLPRLILNSCFFARESLTRFHQRKTPVDLLVPLRTSASLDYMQDEDLCFSMTAPKILPLRWGPR